MGADGSVLAAISVVLAGRLGGFGAGGSRCWDVGIGTGVAGPGGGLELGRWVIWYGWGRG